MMSEIIIKFPRLDIFPTNKCNLLCDFCHGPPKGKVQELEIGLLEKVIDIFKKQFDLQTISIAGGEPTLYYAFSTLVSKLKEDDIKIRLLTNGTTFKKYSGILKTIDEIVLPFDGYDPETFEKMRKNKQLFNEIVVHLKEWYVPNQKISVGVVASKINIDYLHEIMKKLGEINQIRLKKHYSPVYARIFMFAAQSNGAKWKDKFEINVDKFYKAIQTLKKNKELTKWVSHCIDCESESYTCLMLYPGGDVYLPEKDRFIQLTNIYNPEWKTELITYFSLNPTHYEKLMQSHEQNNCRS
ncbi:MAG: radical SAM protein [Candidatus Daviesbacteria bacterium]|nr:radical SAM protein [Candidatus Daviesbacteria bacterium]